MFWTAEYVLHAASILAERLKNKELKTEKHIIHIADDAADELLAQTQRDLGNFYGTKLGFSRGGVGWGVGRRLGDDFSLSWG